MEIIKEVKKKELQSVIAFYGNEAMYHDFENGILGAGRKLTTESAKTIFKFVNDVQDQFDFNFSGLVPANILKFKTDEKYIWWTTAAGIRKLNFEKNTNFKSGDYWVPNLIWKIKGKMIYVWAYKEFGLDKKVYQAPFMNVSSNGSICVGTAAMHTNKYDYETIMQKAELAFWDSYFTHTNADNLIQGNFSKVMREHFDKLQNDPLDNYQDLLFETDKTIGQLLKIKYDGQD